VNRWSGTELAVENDPQYDHLPLDGDACQRMLWLLCGPLMKEVQLEALFSAFDTNRDGDISPSELERLLRLIGGRLIKFKPAVVMPDKVTAMGTALKAVSQAAAPGLAKAGELWQEFSSNFKRDGDDIDD